MKKIRHLSLGLIIITILVLSFGCGQKEIVQSKVDIFADLGFVANIIEEDSKNYVEISVSGGILKLEVEDNELLDGLEKLAFYKFSYDENNVLLSIASDKYIEDLVRKSMKEGIMPHVHPTSKISTDGLVLLDSYDYDITGDGFEETIGMYVNAEQGSDGEIYWDDGQDWLFVVKGQEQDYVLFDGYIQLGTLKFHMYTIDDDFFITTVQSGTANLDIVEHIYVKSSDEFLSTLKHGTTGNVNMIHSSYGY